MKIKAIFAVLAALCASAAQAVEPSCETSNKLGVIRTIAIDATGGPAYGEQYSRSRQFLLPREVVLTFDDGPFPSYTPMILDALDAECTKATFFEVGAMALAHPELTKLVLEKGHTIGTHTWSHANLAGISASAGRQQVERAISAVDSLVPGAVAPFFRFPYLADNKQIRGYLATRNIAIFDIDVDSKDYLARTPDQIVRRVMAGLANTGGGIILMHDIHQVTAKAVPLLLAALKAADYHVVHIVPKAPIKPVAVSDRPKKELPPRLLKRAASE